MPRDRIIAMIVERQSNLRDQIEDCKRLLLVLDRAIRSINDHEYSYDHFTKNQEGE